MGCSLLDSKLRFTRICSCTYLIACIIVTHWTVCVAEDSAVDVTIGVPSETLEGDGALMTCTVVGIATENIRVNWYKWDSPSEKNRVFLFINSKNRHQAENDLLDASNKSRAAGQLDGFVYHLYINTTVLSDGAVYSCAVDKAHEDSRRLTVNVRPQDVTIVGLDQPVYEDSKEVVVCKVGRVKPAADIYWRKGATGSLQTGILSKEPNSDGTFQVESTYTVSFSRRDNGITLHCLVTRHNSSAEVWKTVDREVSVLYPPSAEVKQGSGNPMEGNSFALTCSIIDGNPTDNIKTVMWKKDDLIIVSSNHYKLGGQELTIRSLDHTRDDGQYSCKAENMAGAGIYSDTFHLLVLYKPEVSVSPPDPVVEGQSVTIECQSEARPAVTIVKWKKGQDVIQVTDDNRFNGGSALTPSLTIDPVARTDVGDYTCWMSNDFGDSSGSVGLRVLYKPYGQAIVTPSAVKVAVGGTVTLTCKPPAEAGNPEASWFSWRKQDTDFNSNTTGVLSVEPTTVTQPGRFECTAGNWIGQSNYSSWATLTVEAPAKIEYPRLADIPITSAFDEDFRFTCTASGSGDVMVVWRKDGAAIDPSDFHVMNLTVTGGQYMYEQTDATNSTLMWHAGQKAQYFTCYNITYFEGNYTCAASTYAAGSRTLDASKSFVVNIQYEAHWADGVMTTAAAPNETSKEIVCDVCVNPPPQYSWTFNNESLRDGIKMKENKIVLDVVETQDYGFYACTATNEVSGGQRSATFHIDLVERGPARVPLDVTVLGNHTSVALSLRWRPGFHGGYPPQTFTLQYRTSNEASMKTWADVFTYGAEGDIIWHGATITGLQPNTDYIFSVYAENNRPQDSGPKRSSVVKLMATTTASPQVTLQNVKLAEDHMTVTWLYKVESLRRKRSERTTDTNVSVVIFYQSEGGDESRYPTEGSLAAEEQQATIDGQFDLDLKYNIWLKVYEGQLAVSSQQTTSVEAQVDKDSSSSSSAAVIGSSVAAVVVILVIIAVIVGVLYRRRAQNNKDCTDIERKPDGMLMVHKENEMVDGYSNVACDAVKQTEDNGDAVVYSEVRKKGTDGDATSKPGPATKVIKKQNGKHPPIATKPVGKEQKVIKAEIVQRGNNKKVDNPPKITAVKIQQKKKSKTRGADKKDDEVPYDNVNFGGVEKLDQNLYENIDKTGKTKTQKPPENVGPDGTIYADISFGRSDLVKPHEDITDDDEKVVYAAIDYTKK